MLLSFRKKLVVNLTYIIHNQHHLCVIIRLLLLLKLLWC